MNAGRESAIQEVRSRVRDALGTRLGSQECLAVALAASCARDRDAVLGFLLSTAAHRSVTRHLDSVALSKAEWQTFFGSKNMLPSTAALADVCKDPSFPEQERQLASALRCSLVEAVSREKWKTTASRVACYVALHSENAEEHISACLDGLVKSDSRRLDEVRSLLEDEGADEMLLSKAVLALSECVCGKQ